MSMDAFSFPNEVPYDQPKTRFNILKKIKIKPSADVEEMAVVPKLILPDSDREVSEMLQKLDNDDYLMTASTVASSTALDSTNVPNIATDYAEKTKSLLEELKADIAVYSTEKEMTEGDRLALENKTNQLEDCVIQLSEVTMDLGKNKELDFKNYKTTSHQNSGEDFFTSENHSDLQTLTHRLNESYTLQDRLVAENKNLEDIRLTLQEELKQKETDIERLLKHVDFSESELRLAKKEISFLAKKLEDRANYDPDDDIDEIQKEIRDLKDTLNAVRAERQQLMMNNSLVKKGLIDVSGVNVKKLEEELAEIKALYKALRENFEAALDQIEQLKSEKSKLGQDLENKIE